MVEETAITIALLGCNDFGRSVIPIFLAMNHFLDRFSTFSEQMKKIYRVEVWSFCKMHYRNPLRYFWALRLFVRQFQMPFEGLRFVQTLATFGIIYATDPLPQNMKNVGICWLTYDIFNYKPRRPCWITCANFYNFAFLTQKVRWIYWP